MDYDLQDELIKMLDSLQKQINFVNLVAIDHDVQIYAVRSTDGAFLLAPLLVAKTNALVALVALETAAKEEKHASVEQPKNFGV